MPGTILNDFPASMQDGRINLWCEGGHRELGKVCETENVRVRGFDLATE